MWVLCVVWAVMLFAVQVVCLVKSVRTKDNRNWCALFTAVVSSAISIVLLCVFLWTNLDIDTFAGLFIGIAAILAYALMLLISVMLKVREVWKFRKSNVTREKIGKKALKKAVALPLLLIMAITVCVCAGDFAKCALQKNLETKRYNETKQAETEKMARFVNNKYGLNFEPADCVYYKEEDYNFYEGFLDGGNQSDTPYIAVFESEGRRITAADRNGVISDNAQLKDINFYIGDYFSDAVGADIEYVQIRKAWNGNIPDDTINTILQNGFNEKITQYNIDDFVREVYEQEHLELLFYVKDTEGSAELLKTLESKLCYLEKHENIERIEIYIYDKNEDLLVYNYGTSLDEDYFEDSFDYFDYYFVANDPRLVSDSRNGNSRLKIDRINTFVDYSYIDFK